VEKEGMELGTLFILSNVKKSTRIQYLVGDFRPFLLGKKAIELWIGRKGHEIFTFHFEDA
jgi:hypothetical protein